MITLNRADIEFLLQQVTINYLIPDGNGGFVQSNYFNYSALANALDSSGVREVSGSNNNLVGGYWDPDTFNPLTGQNGVWVTGPNTAWGQSEQPFLNISMGQTSASAPAVNYNVPGAAVADMDPRLISNLVATMFTSGDNANPAAALAATNGDPNAQFNGLQANDPSTGTAVDTAFVANAGVLGGGRYNGWFVSFGQFFDHGLDFVNRDSDPAATITVNLSLNDPLYDADGANNIAGDFDDVTSITIRRADVANESDAGVDGVFGTTDDVGYSTGQDGIGGTADDIYAKPKYINQTGLLIDQSQTYGSDPSVNALIREYSATGQPTGRVVTGHTTAMTDGNPLNDGDANGLATWADIKANALRIGIFLQDSDIHDAPMLRVNAVGKLMYIPNAGETYSTAQILGYDSANQDPNDPFVRDALGNVLRTGQNMMLDFNPGQSLDSHIITGDGRGNENIGLTAVHHVFHEEHNSLVGKIQAQIITEYNAIALTDAAAAAAFIAPWQSSPGVWDGEKLYQAARLITESEYNHIAIDQYVGVLYGALPEFVSYSSDINMGVSLEFSQAVFRLGHSMLTETFNVDVANDPNDLNAGTHKLGLLEMFLNPALYQELGPSALADGLLTTLGNEVDEFVTPALQQSLLGQPLDLAAINIARGRDVNLPTWNEFRSNVYNGLIQNTNNTNGSALAPYTSWADVFDHLKNELTGVNLIAAYARGDGDAINGNHPLADAIVTARAAYEAGTGDIQQLRAAAQAMYDAYGSGVPEAVAFMEGAPVYDPGTRTWNFTAGDQGYWDIDLWVGGLAERPLFDGPLGTTFSYVILDFAQRQQDGDRFYYLYRTPMGTHLGDQIIRNQLTNLVSESTGLTHIGDAFVAATAKYELGAGNDYFNLATHQIFDVDGTPVPASAGHIIIAGNDGDDYIVGGLGDDYIYGETGNDVLFGSQGNDQLHGGAGDDYIYDDENDDFITGGDGNDIIFAGPGVIDTVFGDNGDDEIHGGDGVDELIGGYGDDLVFGDGDTDAMFGNEGNDFMDGGDSVDEMMGAEGNDWMRGGVGDDHLNGGEGNDLLEGGIGAAANDGDRLNGDGGVDFGFAPALPDTGFDVASYEDVNIAITANLDTSNQNGTGALMDTYAGIDGLVGSRFNDNLVGASVETVSANGFNNLMVGGGGDDVLTGLSGDDIIVGDSIAVKNDLSVFYGPASGNYNVITNWKGLGDDRPDFGVNGGLGHFLGENGAAGSNDVAVFSGNFNQYTISAFLADGPNGAPGTVLTDPLQIHQQWADLAGFRVVDSQATRTLADGSVVAGDGTDTVVGVENLRFTDQTINLAQYFDKPPTLDLNYVPGNVNVAADNFSGGGNAYNRGNGWAGNWSETGDNNSSNSGQILVDNADGSNALHFTGGTPAGNFNGATISRTIDLSGYASATLQFSVNEVGLEAGETVTAYFDVDGAGGQAATQLAVFDQNTNSAGTQTYNLTGPFTAGATLSFVSSAMNSNADDLYIDNITVAAPGDTATGNNFTTSYTENAAGVAIAGAVRITDPDDSNILSAKVNITNPIAGDQLTLGGLPGGIVGQILNGGRTVQLSGSGSWAVYQTALLAIAFLSTSDNPTNAARTIEVTVNDGVRDSNVATATVNVTPVNDPSVLANDSVITNAGTNNFIIPDWALLANDTDPDTTLTVSNVNSASNLSASHSGSNVSVTDGAPANGGSFRYYGGSVNSGDASRPTVTVTQQAGLTLTGASGNDILIGTSAPETINGNAGDDIIIGNGGIDTINGGDGSDVIGYTIGDGADVVDGGLNTALGDLLRITGTTSNETLDVLWNGTSLTSVEGGTVTGIERVTADLLGSSDTLSYVGSSAGANVNLGAGTASGFTSIANISNAVGTASADTLTGSSGNNTFTGGAGNDVINGGSGGNDTAVFANSLTNFDINLNGAGTAVTVADTSGVNNLGSDTVSNIDSLQFNGTSYALRAGTNAANTINATNTNAELFVGGAGNDTFVFETGESGNNATSRDVIADFAFGDRINIDPWDANQSSGGNQDFANGWVGSFSALAQLRYFLSGNDTIIEGNNNGSTAGDFQIVLLGYTGTLQHINNGTEDYITV